MAPIYEAYNKTGVMDYDKTYETVLDPIQYRNFTLWMSSQKSDRMKFWLRTHEGLTFGFSISFFLFIQRGDRQIEAANAIIYTLILLAFIVCSIITWVHRG